MSWNSLFLGKYVTRESLRARDLVLPVALILGGFSVGLLIEVFLLTRLKKKYKTLAGALQGMTVLLFTIMGIYGAVHTIPMDRELLVMLRTVLHVTMILAGTVMFTRFAVGLILVWTKAAETALASMSIVTHVVQLGTYLVGALVIVHSFGFSIAPLLTALGAGGFLLALGLQNTLSNLIAGLHLIASKKIRPGDYIKLDSGEEGQVADIAWRETTIKMLEDNVVIIPNGKLAMAIVTNYSLPEKELTVLTEVGVSYESDLAHVEGVTVQTAREVMGVVGGGQSGFEPSVRYYSFGDSTIRFTVVMRVKEFVDQYYVRHEFIKRLHERYRQEGISIPFPSRTIYLKGLESILSRGAEPAFVRSKMSGAERTGRRHG